jgi:hypothetical protein
MTTAAELHALIAEHAAAEAALEALAGREDAERWAAEERHMRAFRAVLQARPTDPATMGRQLRWIVTQAIDADIGPALRHIVEQLEAMGATK